MSFSPLRSCFGEKIAEAASGKSNLILSDQTESFSLCPAVINGNASGWKNLAIYDKWFGP